MHAPFWPIAHLPPLRTRLKALPAFPGQSVVVSAHRLRRSLVVDTGYAATREFSRRRPAAATHDEIRGRQLVLVSAGALKDVHPVGAGAAGSAVPATGDAARRENSSTRRCVCENSKQTTLAPRRCARAASRACDARRRTRAAAKEARAQQLFPPARARNPETRRGGARRAARPRRARRLITVAAPPRTRCTARLPSRRSGRASAHRERSGCRWPPPE